MEDDEDLLEEEESWENMTPNERRELLAERKMEEEIKAEEKYFKWRVENVSDVFITNGVSCSPVEVEGKRVLACDAGLFGSDFNRYYITRKASSSGNSSKTVVVPDFKNVSFEGIVDVENKLKSFDDCAIYGFDKGMTSDIRKSGDDISNAYEELECGLTEKLMDAIDSKHADPDFGGTRFTKDYQLGNVNPYL